MDEKGVSFINCLKTKILAGESITRAEALQCVSIPLDPLCQAADQIRQHFCGNKCEICSIINAKSGRCSENCKFCAQSAHYKTPIEEYPLLDKEQILAAAQKDATACVQRFSIVTSGRKLSSDEVVRLCETMQQIKAKTSLKLCASCGLLNKEDFEKLKEAGLSRYHNNLESSENFFKQVCTTHGVADKIKTLKAAQACKIELCSGGIVGLGETWEDRIDMAFLAKDLGVVSMPINLLTPIPGTPYEHNKILGNDEMRRICAIFRLILPNIWLRLAGGRRHLQDKGKSCLQSGANALISGDMLTTSGITVQQDLEMVRSLGFYVEN